MENTTACLYVNGHDPPEWEKKIDNEGREGIAEALFFCLKKGWDPVHK